MPASMPTRAARTGATASRARRGAFVVAGRLAAGALLAALTLLATPRSGLAADDFAERRERAITKARAWLTDHVFALPETAGTPRKPFTVALYGLIELRAAPTREARARGGEVARARRYLERWLDDVERRAASDAALPSRHGLASSEHLVQYTWPAALALWFLAEAEGVVKTPRAERPLLRRFAQLLADAQQQNGGFGHGRVRPAGSRVGREAALDIPGGYPATLVSATYVVLAALGHARKLLGGAAEGMGQKAVDHLLASQLPGGLQPYDTSQRSAHLDPTGVPRAAGAAYALHAWDVPWSHHHQVRALERVDERLDLLSEGHGSSMLGLWFGALLQRARGPRAWADYREVHVPSLLVGQQDDGRLPCPCRGDTFGATDDDEPIPGMGAALPAAFRDGSDAYVTALGTLILLLDREPAANERPDRPRGDVTPR